MGVTHIAVTEILAIFRENGFLNLPKDARTLLKTPAKSSISKFANGSYAHIGMAKSLMHQLPLIDTNVSVESLLIDINIDGLPISRSSSTAFWPILGVIRNVGFDLPPFLIGIYQGEAKPSSSSEFLDPFVTEYKELQHNPIEFRGKIIETKIRAFVCDVPATAFVKGTKGHTGFFSCGKCVQEGDYINNRTCFPDTQCMLRTDESFRKRLQEEHHTSDSKLEDIGIGMVSQFPLDYLHLVCLGVTKKIIELMMSKGPMSVRLSNRQRVIINDRLKIAETSRPTDINRATGRIELYKMWKGTNLRSFLLYLGPICLKGVIAQNVYENFMLLSNAIRILCNPNMCSSFAHLAKKLIEKFIDGFIRIYGKCFVSINVHSLIHLPDDVLVYGHLDNFSAFPFESHMSKIKRMIRKGNKQLEQVVNRTIESYHNVLTCNPSLSGYPKLLKPIKIEKSCVKFEKIAFKNYFLSNDDRNKWFISKDNIIYKFENAYVQNKQILINCQQLRLCTNFFVTPFDSSNVLTLRSNGDFIETKSIIIGMVSHKMFAIKETEDLNDKSIILLHLLHT